jgi:hypothetical protein
MGKENILRYPIAPHLLRAWKRGELSGTIELPLGEARPCLRIEYRQYHAPEYFLGRHFLGQFLLDERPLCVRESYRYESITNSGRVTWQGTATSDEGMAACSEIVMAHQAEQLHALRETKAGVFELLAGLDVDQSFHEIEQDVYRCRLELDSAARAVTLERSYFRDAST